MAKRATAKKPTTGKASAQSGAYKICKKCLHKNPTNVRLCAKCSGDRFAPSYILETRPLNRATSINVTESHPQYPPVQKRITLNRWWRGMDAQRFHVRNADEWDKIRSVVDTDLGPLLGWKPYSQQVKSAIAGAKAAGKERSDAVTELVQTRPSVLHDIAEALSSKKLSAQDIDDALALLKAAAEIFANTSAQFKEQFLKIIAELSKASQRGLEQLDGLLANWSLQQIAAVAQQVRNRLDTIELFRRVILDENTYELSGDNSIHRNIEKSMWLISEDYWLLQSNQSLRTFIGEQMAKDDQKRYGKKRPDFVCCTTGNKLILIELKRPSHTLTADDLTQLETYYIMAKKYSGSHKTFEGYLVGAKADDDVRARIELRRGSTILTYTDLLDGVEKRYKEYLDALAKTK